MTTVPKRLGLKFSLKQKPQSQPQDILPIFQRWIQEHTVAGMLIDVIDYKHVPDGPGIVLIADEADFAYDLGDGEIGLHYIRKRALPDDLAGAMRLVFAQALDAARALEAEAPGDIVFDYGSAKITFFDRMLYRNDAATLEGIRPGLTACLEGIFGCPLELTRVYEDPRRLLALRCRAQGTPVDVEAMIQRLGDSLQTV